MIEAVRKRRSVRTFTDQPVEPEKLEQILRAGMQAPSAHNIQPWEFLVVTDEADKKAVSEMSPYAKMAARAPMLIIVCGNRERLGGRGRLQLVARGSGGMHGKHAFADRGGGLRRRMAGLLSKKRQGAESKGSFLPP